MQKVNITKWENLAAAGKNVGLDLQQLENDFNGQAKELFKQDLEFAAKLGVRGFPTMFFVDAQGNQEKVYGTKPYAIYEEALLKQFPKASKKEINADWKALFEKFNTLTTREFSELSQTPREQAEPFLQKLVESGNLSELPSKNGSLWRLVPGKTNPEN